jgi:methionyl-tRNA formyltransferase
MNILFAGTPIFSAEILKHLITQNHSIVGLLTQPDRKQGRGMKLTPSPVKQVAQNHHMPIPVWQPLHFNLLKLNEIEQEHAIAFQKWFQELVLHHQIDVCVVVAYGLIIPKWFLELVPCINIHASLLPRWRGAAPIHRAIESGDLTTGVQIMQMEEGLDTGAVLYGESINILDTDTTPILHDKLIELGKNCMDYVLKPHHFQDLWNKAIPQSIDGIIYAHKIDKTEYHLQLQQFDADAIERKIRAFYPYTFVTYEDLKITNLLENIENIMETRLKVLQASVLHENEFPKISELSKLSESLITESPKTNIYIAHGIFACRNDNNNDNNNTFIQLQQVQKAGGKPISWQEFYQSL